MRRLFPLLLLLGCPTAEPVLDDDDAAPLDDDDDVLSPPDFSVQDVTAAWGIDYVPPVSPDQPQSFEESEGIAGDWVMGGGGVLDDLDGDGRLDLLLTAPFAANRLHRGTADGFVEVPGSGLEGADWTFGAVAADLDADGLRDVLLIEDHAVRYLHNDGGMAFSDRGALVTVDELERPSGVAIVDVDGDGDLDLHVCVIGRRVDVEPRVGLDRMLRGVGDGTYEDISESFAPPEARNGQCFQSNWFDLDGDGVLELFVANDHFGVGPGPFLLRRAGDDPWVYENVAHELGADVGVHSMGSAVGDLDGDGFPEVAISDVESEVVLLSYNEPASSFVDVTAAWRAWAPEVSNRDASWAMQMVDLDHNGHLDLLTTWGYPHHVPRDTWAEQRHSVWMNRFGTLEHFEPTCDVGSYSWRAVLPGDIDADGSMDLVLTSNVGPACVLRGTAGGSWLEVDVEGPAGNQDALGALVVVAFEDDGDARRLQHRVAAGNSGVHSSTEPIARFGTATATAVDVTVTWPDGTTAELLDVATQQRIVVPRP